MLNKNNVDIVVFFMYFAVLISEYMLQLLSYIKIYAANLFFNYTLLLGMDVLQCIRNLCCHSNPFFKT